MNSALLVALLTATFAQSPTSDKGAPEPPPVKKSTDTTKKAPTGDATPDADKPDAKPDAPKPDAPKPDTKKPPKLPQTPTTFAGKPAPPIALPEKYPTKGEEIVITLAGPAAGATAVEFIYQPDSRVVKKQTLTRANELTGSSLVRVKWTPMRAGIVTINAVRMEGDETTVIASKDVSVQFDGVPLGGLLIFVFAGLILFGGVWFSMRLIFAKD